MRGPSLRSPYLAKDWERLADVPHSPRPAACARDNETDPNETRSSGFLVGLFWFPRPRYDLDGLRNLGKFCIFYFDFRSLGDSEANLTFGGCAVRERPVQTVVYQEPAPIIVYQESAPIVVYGNSRRFGNRFRSTPRSCAFVTATNRFPDRIAPRHQNVFGVTPRQNLFPRYSGARVDPGLRRSR